MKNLIASLIPITPRRMCVQALAEGSTRETQIRVAPPPNGGRAAWLAIFGYFFVCLGTLGVQYAFGTLYSEVVARP